MIRRNYILTILLTAISFLAVAQPKSFSKKPADFIVELNSYLDTKPTKEGSEVAKIFTEKWENDSFSNTEMRTFINVSNDMLLNDLQVREFYLLQETILLGKDSVGGEKYQNWLEALRPSIKSGNKTFLTLLTASRNLFRENVLFQNATKTWFSSKNNYIFKFEGNRVKISFENVDLTCQAAADEMVIYNTTGSYYLDNDRWIGNGGRITWERVGIAADNMYADIPGGYVLRFDRAELEVDTVLFMNEDFLSRPIEGSLRERVSSAKELPEESRQNSPFPQFNSFQKNLELGSYLEGRIAFKGGYAMKGSEIIATGSATNPSIVEIKYKEDVRVVARSQYFSLKEDQIKALEAEVTILTDSGSIYHPKVTFNLNLENKVLFLTRGKKGLEQAPFFNTDHEVEIYVDQVIWNLDLPKIEFDMAANESKAIVESNEFYKEIKYERIPRGMLAYHPLSKMRDFVVRERKREFTFTEYADWMGSRQTYLKPQIVELADLGYIFFNPDTDSIRVRRKLDHAVLSHMKLKDYDVIRFASVIGARSNGYLNLINNTFILEGVRAFRFSDSQSVYAFPSDQKVILKHKRRMEFGGKVTAGKFDFWSDQFLFDYYRFDISSDLIDSMRIYTRDFEFGNNLVAVKSVLRDINGTLEIDKSTNKSGLEDYPEYPIFTSRKGAVIAYDKKSIHGGAYKKDKFRFEVDPFTIDSLDNFQTSGLKFPGNFVSGGILPEFRYEVGIMDDYSLGFERVNPPGGYEMYGGAGHGEIDIKLSEEGFTAKGTISYQDADISSTDIIMMPDSTLAAAESYNVREDEKYPNIFATDVLTKWMPKKDSLWVNTNNHKVQVLRDNQQFQGNLIQTSRQIAGNGALTWDRAKLTSKDMKFKPNKVDANISAVEIGAYTGDKIAFSSDNMESHIDFTTRIGDMKQNVKGNFTEFPFNTFASSMDEYKWDMDAETIELNKGAGMASNKSRFVSRNPGQDGLNFQSTNALFDMKEGIIYAHEVPFIDVADSRAFPFEGDVTVKEMGRLAPLENSKLFANRKNRYHELFDATLKIGGRYALAGEGKYIYKDKHNSGQVIFMDKLRVVRGKIDSTVLAAGFVRDSLNFEVSPKIGYKGKVELNSQQEFISFNGYVKPLHSFEQYPSAWFRYNQQPDPIDVIIPAHKPRSEDNRTMAAALSIANDSTHIYPSFANFKRSYADLELTRDTGIMFYEENEQTFYLGDSGKLLNGNRRGSYLAFNDATKEIYSEGEIDFGLDLSENFIGYMAGNISRKAEDTTFLITSVLDLRMVLPPECFDRMVEVIKTNGSQGYDGNEDDFVQNALAEFMNDRDLGRVTEDLGTTGQLKMVGPLVGSSMLLTKLKMRYEPNLRVFVGRDQVHVASIGGQQVNRVVDSRVVMRKNRAGSRVTIYLEASKYDWFYIDYYAGTIYVSSTDLEFNNAIKEKGPKYSKGKLRIRSASPRTVSNWLSKVDPKVDEIPGSKGP